MYWQVPDVAAILEVDINFHNGDEGYKLVKSNTIRIPAWHSWHCFQCGDPGQHQPPGKMNLLFNNNALYKNGQSEASAAGVEYMVNPVWEGKRVFETALCRRPLSIPLHLQAAASLQV